MNLPGNDRWRALLRSAGASEVSSGWYDRLAVAYAKPERHYHNGRHVRECLREFEPVRHLAIEPAAVELALWFHDAVCDPRANDNEHRSAGLARQCLEECGVARGFADRVAALILATTHQDSQRAGDAAFVTDVDLSILGSDRIRFLEYEKQVRREYSWVPAAVYSAKRTELIQRFLAPPRIFATDRFHGKYEGQARSNLQMSVRMLSGGSR